MDEAAFDRVRPRTVGRIREAVPSVRLVQAAGLDLHDCMHLGFQSLLPGFGIGSHMLNHRPHAD